MTVEETIAALDRGELRVAEKRNGEWIVNEQAKGAIIEYFRLREVEPQELGLFEYRDKIPLKHGYEELGVRVVPPATARFGAFLSRDVILMPSYVNIGAWVGPRTMVDTWATVGSCAQIGADVHLAGGVGIGGVLEPVGARRRAGRDRAAGRAQRHGADHRRDRGRARRASRLRPTAVGRRPGHAAEGVSGRHVPARVRADHRAAQGVDRPTHEPQRSFTRLRHRLLVCTLGGAGQPRAAAFEPHAQIAAGEGHDDLAVAVRRQRDGDRARA